MPSSGSHEELMLAVAVERVEAAMIVSEEHRWKKCFTPACR